MFSIVVHNAIGTVYQFISGFDTIEEDKEHFNIKGWTFLKNMNSKDTRTNLLLRYRNNLYRVNAGSGQ